MDPERCKVLNEVKHVKKTTIVSSINLADIPEGLLMEVLIRLPVKLLFSCKLVCKRWISVISDQSFIRMYVSRASSFHTWILIYSSLDGNQNSESKKYEMLDDVYSLDLKCPLYNSRDVKCPSLYVVRQPFSAYGRMERNRFVGVSNGIFLYIPYYRLSSDRRYVYNICNPFTRQCISLPPHATCFYGRVGFVTRVENGVLSSYRVVRLYHRPTERSGTMTFEVYISEISEWKGFDVHTEQEMFGVTYRHPIALNGILHWITRAHGIIAYDPYQEPDSLRFIPLPRDADPTCNNEHNGIPSFCDAYQGQLRYFEVSHIVAKPRGFSSLGVWTLNDYSTGDWCLQHRISSADIPYDEVLLGKFLFMKPIAFHPFDSEIVYLMWRYAMVSYNIKTRKLEWLGSEFDGSMDRMDCWMWIFPLVIPPWPIFISNPSSSSRVLVD